MNSFKVPFSAGLGLITLESLKFNLLLLPAILAGALLGYWLIRVIPQKWFEVVVVVLAIVGAVRLIV